MNTQQESESVEVFAGNILEAGMVKSILENAGIRAYLGDEILGTLSPWWASPGGAGAVKVVVSKWDHERARAVVEDYEKNIKEE